LRQIFGQCGEADADRFAFATEVDECKRKESANRAIEVI